MKDFYEDNFSVSGIYGSGMVLQRNTKNCIFGKGALSNGKSCKVTLDFCGQNYSTLADEQGKWKIEFQTAEAGGPYKMELQSAGKSIVFEDVWVGEVWVNSGQSNAQLTMERLKYSYPHELELPENPHIRMITIPITYSFDGEKDSIPNPEWKAAAPDTLAGFSGTAYFFAKKLAAELKVPLGIINTSQGGSPIYAWMNDSSFKELGRKDYLDRIDYWKKASNIEENKAKVLAAQQKWDKNLYEGDKGLLEHWEKLSLEEVKNKQKASNCKCCESFDIPGDFTLLGKDGGAVWFKKTFELTQNQLEILEKNGARIWFGTIQDADTIWINGNYCGSTGYSYPPRRYPIPANTLKVGINEVTVRVQKNGPGAIRFFQEKPYFIFSNNVYVHPVAYRNVEVPENINDINTAADSQGVKIDLSGQWDYFIAYQSEARPGELFFEWEPSALYNSMLAPCFNYAVAGALWYQGESNAGESADYKALLCKMIELWRKKFLYAPENMPFVIMQLPNWAEGYKEEKDWLFGDWPAMREAVIQTAKEVKNTASVCMIDAGEWNDLHPEKKLTGGTRAAIQALRLAYSRPYDAAPQVALIAKNACTSVAPHVAPNVASSASPSTRTPVASSAQISFTVKFDCGTSSLHAYKVNGERADFSTQDQKVYGFEFLTKNNKVIPAEARLISDTEVEVYLKDGLNAEDALIPAKADDLSELRYLWSSNPWIVNLYSSQGLPAEPFRSYSLPSQQ